MSLRRRLFALSQLLFAVAILCGSSFEVLNLLVPSLVPEIQEVPLMRLHHEIRVVFYWTVISNIVSALLGIRLIQGAIGTFRDREDASRISRRAIAGFYVILAGAAVVSAVYLLPPILEMLRVPAEHTIGVVMLISVFSSLAGLAVMLTILFAGHGFIERRQRGRAAA